MKYLQYSSSKILENKNIHSTKTSIRKEFNKTQNFSLKKIEASKELDSEILTKSDKNEDEEIIEEKESFSLPGQVDEKEEVTESKPKINEFEEEDKEFEDLLEMDDYVKELLMKQDSKLLNKINHLTGNKEEDNTKEEVNVSHHKKEAKKKKKVF